MDVSKTVTKPAPPTAVPFGVNEIRLNGRQWLAVLAILLACAGGIPRLWKQIERFDTGSDYRIPYALSSDYWLYQWRLEKISDPASVPVLGDSVVWGEYVRSDGTLTHFLNREAGAPDRFVNCGVNGVFPLAIQGLIEHYGGALRHRKVILHCNVLWMSSPAADLSTDKEESFNHTELVPQLFSRIPCYHADATARLNAVAKRSIGFFGWVDHLDGVYFDHLSAPGWTLEDDGGDPPRFLNAWRNPLSRITLTVPGEPKLDPQRGPSSPRHRPWNARGETPTHFEWVDLERSLQWRAFRQTIDLLRDRGDDVLVILGPFNEYMVAEDQRPVYRRIRDDIGGWLTKQGIAHVIPDTLPSSLYADDSHPLTDGYALLAHRIALDPVFREWLEKK